MIRSRVVLIAWLIAAAVNVPAAEITIDEVLRAHDAGVSSETLLQLIEAADAVPVLTSEDETRLREAGVPDGVITALSERARRLEKDPATVEPDDRRLVEIVRLVRAGLSDELIVRKIETDSERYRPSINDLVFLKSNGVSDTVIAVLMETAMGEPTERSSGVSASTPASATAQAAAPSTAELERRGLEFGPVLRVTTAAAVFKKSTEGTTLLIEDRIEYRDSEDAERNVAFFGTVLKRARLKCTDPMEPSSCFELVLKPAHGDDLRLRDVDWERGGNREIEALYAALRDRYPKVKYKRVKD